MVKVVWAKLALKQLQKSYFYIREESPQSANKVRDAIFRAADNLKNNPEIYPLDKYRKNNDGSVRAFELYSHRIAYQILHKEIRILRVRHTSRNPFPF